MTQPPNEAASPQDPRPAAGNGSNRSDEGAEHSGPTIRDRRRIDPETFEVREPQATPAATRSEASESSEVSEPSEGEVETGEVIDPQQAQVDDLTRQLAERTDDLQRLQAEYVNYKRRVDRDRETARKATIGSVMNELLPVLDNITSAREHDELVGGFKAAAESVEKVARSHGLEAFGAVGDVFDPHLHDALMQLSDAGDGHPVCAQIFQVGYRIGERVLRPARVAVGAPPSADADQAPRVAETELAAETEPSTDGAEVSDPDTTAG